MLCPDFLYWAIQRDGHTKVNSDHICFFDINTLKTLLKRSGFIVKEIMYQNAGFNRAKLIGLDPEEWMGKRIYMIAIKKEDKFNE